MCEVGVVGGGRWGEGGEIWVGDNGVVLWDEVGELNKRSVEVVGEGLEEGEMKMRRGKYCRD